MTLVFFFQNLEAALFAVDMVNIPTKDDKINHVSCFWGRKDFHFEEFWHVQGDGIQTHYGYNEGQPNIEGLT